MAVLLVAPAESTDSPASDDQAELSTVRRTDGKNFSKVSRFGFS